MWCRSTAKAWTIATVMLWPVAALAQPATEQPAEPAAEPPPPSAEADGADAKLAQAKELFEQGNALRKARDFERALERYVASRELVPSVANTVNAGVCLSELGRYDEALELYEEVLSTYRDKIDDAERRQITAELARLRAKVGSIEVAANVRGTLVIDGRRRGELPLVAPVRVLPGRHTVVVLAEGHAGFEATVEVAVGKTARVSASLEPLSASGEARVVDPALEGATLFVDGAPLGEAPWRGTLAPGPHRYFFRRGDSGSAPASVIIVEGQTTLLEATLSKLGPDMRIAVEPPSAELSLGEVTLGRGRWQGRLPIGEHRLEIHEEGYVSKTQMLTVTAAMKGDLRIALEVDDDHPRWTAGREGHLWLDVVGGVALAGSLGSGAEASCDEITCSSDGVAIGMLTALRGGYELWFGLSFELAAGYVRVSKEIQRSFDDAFMLAGDTVDTRTDLTDSILVHGPFGAAGIGYRLPLHGVLELRAHTLVGAMYARGRTDVGASVQGQGRSVSATTQGSGEVSGAANLIVIPEVHLGARFDNFMLSGGLSAAIFALAGPDQLGVVEVNGDCLGSGGVDCAPSSSRVAGERAYGSFVTWLPSVSAGYMF